MSVDCSNYIQIDISTAKMKSLFSKTCGFVTSRLQDQCETSNITLKSEVWHHETRAKLSKHKNVFRFESLYFTSRALLLNYYKIVFKKGKYKPRRSWLHIFKRIYYIFVLIKVNWRFAKYVTSRPFDAVIYP